MPRTFQKVKCGGGGGGWDGKMEQQMEELTNERPNNWMDKLSDTLTSKALHGI